MAECDGEMVAGDGVWFFGCAYCEGAAGVFVQIGAADAAPVDVYCYLRRSDGIDDRLSGMDRCRTLH